MKKIFITTFFLTLCLISSKSNAQDRPFLLFDGPAYFNTCYLTIEGLALIDVSPLMATQAAYRAEFIQISTTFALMSKMLGDAITSAGNDLAAQQYTMAEKNYAREIEIKRELESAKNDHKIHRSKIEKYNKNAKFPVHFYEKDQWPEIKKDTPEWDYYKAVCDQDKIAKEGLGIKSNQKTALAVNLEGSMRTKQQLNSSNAKTLMNEQQSMIINKYAEGTDKPYANLMANNFITPSGNTEKNKISPFKTKLTYSDSEKEVATDFLRTVIMPFSIDPPKSSEIGSSNNKYQEFVGLYASNLSYLNLAHHSFAVAKQKRNPTVKVQIPGSEEVMDLSYYDNLRYMIHQTGSEKTMASIKNAGGTAAQENNYKIKILNTKLQMEIYMQKERINLLDAAIIAAMQNSGKTLEYMNNLK